MTYGAVVAMAEDKGTGSGLKCFRAVVHGRVQGVNFRYYTRERARSLGVAGHVRNRWDGTVEVLAEGRAEALRRLLSWLRVGPRLAQVTRVQVSWEAPSNVFHTFEVRY
jgi:acylphosphatase